MLDEPYLNWLVRTTPTTWWHDSADPDELRAALVLGASGVTSNPFLTNVALHAHPERWREVVAALPAGLRGEPRAEALMRLVLLRLCPLLLPCYESTEGRGGYVCAQVNPARVASASAMLEMARRFHNWAPNITVKLPGTTAGLDTLAMCVAEGISVTMTVSFTVPQVLAVAERYRGGLQQARKAGTTAGRCFAVIMLGRLDDYLRDIALDRRAPVDEADIQQAGLAVVKRAYSLYKERGYETQIIVAALRSARHMTELAGADLIMSIHPSIQAKLALPDVPRTVGIDTPVAPDVIERLLTIPEFRRSYEPDGMGEHDFLPFGLSQRTLTQFTEAGWRPLETYGV